MNRIIVAIIAAFGLMVSAGNPPDQQKSSISGAATVANGTSWSSVTIFLRDANGNHLTSNDWISITSSSTATSFDPSTTTLDGSGTIYTKMRSTTVGNVPVIVTDNTTSTQITGSVVFYTPGTDPPAPGACTDAAPGSAPTLSSAVSVGANSVTLTWTKAVSPVTYYLVSYGTSSGSYQYGNPNVGGPETTSYTVGGLTTGTRYYFAVRAVNGCSPGTYSNEQSAVAGVDEASPTPTPTLNMTPTPLTTPVVSGTVTPSPKSTPTVLVTPVPTDIPVPSLMPSPIATFPPLASPQEGPSMGTIILIATIIGIVIAIGVGVYLVIESRNRNKPPPLAY